MHNVKKLYTSHLVSPSLQKFVHLKYIAWLLFNTLNQILDPIKCLLYIQMHNFNFYHYFEFKDQVLLTFSWTQNGLVEKQNQALNSLTGILLQIICKGEFVYTLSYCIIQRRSQSTSVPANDVCI